MSSKKLYQVSLFIYNHVHRHANSPYPFLNIYYILNLRIHFYVFYHQKNYNQ